MSVEVKVTQLKNKIVVDNTANVVHVITQGEQGAKGLEWTVASPAPYHTFSTPPKVD